MADSGSITLSASILPDEIRKTFTNEKFTYTPADATEGWYYKLTNVQSTVQDLMSAEAINKSAGTNTNVALTSSVVANDLVKFLFIKNTGTTNGSSTTAESVVVTFDNNGVTDYDETDGIVIPAGMTWYGHFARLPMNHIHAITMLADESAVGTGPVQCVVAAIIDDV